MSVSRVGLLIVSLLGFVFQPMTALAAQETGAITGTVRATSGAPIAGAQIVLIGGGRQQTSTDANGAFTFASLPIGLYQLQVNKGGYLSAGAENLAVFTGGTLTENIVLQQPDLSSLHTIATVASSAHSSINTSAASETIVTAQEIQNVANPQVNEILQETPGVNLSRNSSSPNTNISLGGVQPYETQVLIDGHPLSSGVSGSWISQYFNSYMLGGIETEMGPGNTTPFAGNAIGGTVNFLTPSYNGHPTTAFTQGMDSYGSLYSDFTTTGKVGQLSYVLAAGYNSENGPYNGSTGCVVRPGNSSLVNQPGSTGVIQFCGDLSAPLFEKGELAKLHYDFSPVTSFEVAYIGSQSGFYPQASSYGQYAGNITIVKCMPVSGGGQDCTNPADSAYIGKTINGYIMYPGSNVFNDQPVVEGQFRTAIGNNTLLVRPYAGTILRDIDGGAENLYPGGFYPSNATGSALTADQKYCTNSLYGGVGTTSNGMTECNQDAYTTFELDRLRGTTVSFIHPFGENEVTATYNYNSDQTYAQAGDVFPNQPLPVTVPTTLARSNIFSLTGNFAIARNLNLAAGVYDTNWQLTGWQAYVASPTSSAVNVPLFNSVNHFDPHVAFTYNPVGGLAYRMSFGSSIDFPFANEVSGIPSFNPGSATGNGYGTLTTKNPYLQPEVAHEWDLGVDKRLHNGAILSFDYLGMDINNVFESLTTPVTNPLYSYIKEPINAANLQAQQGIVKYNFQPNLGLGYYVTATVDRSIVSGIPLGVYGTSYATPANGVQICGSICIPYLKAFGALQYTWRDQTYAMMGVDFEGKNNSYNQGPLALVNATIRRPVSHQLSIQISADNLLNTNTYDNLVMPNLGTPYVGENNKGQYGTYTTAIIPAAPRTIRMQIEWRQADGFH